MQEKSYQVFRRSCCVRSGHRTCRHCSHRPMLAGFYAKLLSPASHICWCKHVGVVNLHLRCNTLGCITPIEGYLHCVLILFFFYFFFIIISVCSVGQRMFPSGLHHTNEEEESRCRVSTEAPSALQSHLFDTQR